MIPTAIANKVSRRRTTPCSGARHLHRRHLVGLYLPRCPSRDCVRLKGLIEGAAD
ncbi:unnamed protein product [Camellia sinensis]